MIFSPLWTICRLRSSRSTLAIIASIVIAFPMQMGFTPQYVVGSWVGFDEEAPLGRGETGSRAASPIWLNFMQQAMADLPVETFKPPETIDFIKIDAESGLLPIPDSKETILECFKEGTAPTQYAKRPGEVTETADFFKKDL